MPGVPVGRRLIVLIACLAMAFPAVPGSAQEGRSPFRLGLEPDLALAMPLPSDLDKQEWLLSSSYPVLRDIDAGGLLFFNQWVPDRVEAVLESDFRGGYTQMFSTPPKSGLLIFTILAMNDADAAFELRSGYLEYLEEQSSASPGELVIFSFDQGSDHTGSLIEDHFMLMVRYAPRESTNASPTPSPDTGDSIAQVEAYMSTLQQGLDRAQELAATGTPGPGQMTLVVTSDETLSYNWVLGSFYTQYLRVWDGQVVQHIDVTTGEALVPAPASLQGQTTEVVNRQGVDSTVAGTGYWWEMRMLSFDSEALATAYIDSAEIVPEAAMVDWQMDVSPEVTGPNNSRDVTLQASDGLFGVGVQRIYTEGTKVVVVTMLMVSDGELPPDIDSNLDQPIDQLGTDQLACLMTPQPCAHREPSVYFPAA